MTVDNNPEDSGRRYCHLDTMDVWAETLVSRNLTATYAAPDGDTPGLLLSGQELDDLLPVSDGNQRRPSLIWSDMRTHYPMRQVSPDQQIAYVFAQVCQSVTPNELSHTDTVGKVARYMRAMQSGVQQRLTERGVSVPRDASEAYTAELLANARDFTHDSPRLAFDLARKEAGLRYTPSRRLRRIAEGVRAALPSAI